jgi:hypothetical protein
MDTSLESVLSGQSSTTGGESGGEAAETQQTTTTTETEGSEGTGEQTTASPADTQKDEPLEKHRKGLEAAALAERTRRQAAEQRAAAAEAELRTLRQPKPELQQTTTEQGNQEPQREAFASDTDYIRALARHEAKALREAEKAEESREAAERQAQEHAQVLQRTADEIVTKGQKQFSDFDAVINGGLAPHLTPALHEALLLSDRGHEVAYWLANNQAEAQRMAGLTPQKLVRELTLIEIKLDAKPPGKDVELPDTLTNERDSRGRFKPAYQGPTPLNAILATK